MRVLLANNSGAEARRLAESFPDRVGHLYGPASKRGPFTLERLLWQAHRVGAESCDGSGWFRGDRSQLDGLWYYLADSSDQPSDAAHGPHQQRLFAHAAQ